MKKIIGIRTAPNNTPMTIKDQNRGIIESIVNKMSYINTTITEMKLTEKIIFKQNLELFDDENPQKKYFYSYYCRLLDLYFEIIIFESCSCLDIIAKYFLNIYFPDMNDKQKDFGKLLFEANKNNTKIPTYIKDMLIKNNNEWIGKGVNSEYYKFRTNYLTNYRNLISHHTNIPHVVCGWSDERFVMYTKSWGCFQVDEKTGTLKINEKTKKPESLELQKDTYSAIAHEYCDELYDKLKNFIYSLFKNDDYIETLKALITLTEKGNQIVYNIRSN